MERVLNKIATLAKGQYNYLSAYAFCFFILVAYYFLSWPIFAGDTDLWYHLSGGRYFFDHNTIPDSSYFSFLAPAKTWVDYYWLFQVLVYKVHSFWDYYGLVFLRAIIYLGTVAVIFSYVTAGNIRRPLSAAEIVIFISYALLIIPRFQLVRPHIFSSLLVVVFLFILETKPKKAFLLPLGAILWANLHGIEYPVLILICVAYLGEIAFQHIRQRNRIKLSDLALIVPLLISLGAIYLTPHGSKLLELPFRFPPNASLYISEMARFSLADFFSFQIFDLLPTHATIFNVLLITICLTVLLSLFRKRMRVSHFILFAGGIFLLSRGLRFKYEFALLALPVLVAQSGALRSSISSLRDTSLPKVIYLLGTIMLSILPFLYLKQTFSDRPKYPFSHKSLPHGVATFLNHVDVGGSVLNTPENGGYLQWMLFPRYKICMDLEMSLFTDEDYFRTVNSFHDQELLREFVSKYAPAFVTVSLKRKPFKRLIQKFPEYVPVFFDDAEVLYVSKAQHPEVAEKFRLRRVDPFELEKTDLTSLEPVDRHALLAELLRLHEIYPQGAFVNQMIAILLKENGAPDEGIQYADLIITDYPEIPQGYAVKADLLTALERFEEAADLYRLALDRSNERWMPEVRKKLWLCYTKLEQHRKAYGTLKKAVNPFSVRSRYEDIFNLGSSALMIGKQKEGKLLLELAELKVPEDNIEWRERIGNLLAVLEDEAKPPGLPSSTR